PPDARGRAISTVVLGGTVGAVFGPFLVGPAGETARRFGLDELSGPAAVSSILFLAVVLLLWLRLRPEPRELASHMAAARAADPAGGSEARRPLAEILRQPEARLAVVALVCGQAVMVML